MSDETNSQSSDGQSYDDHCIEHGAWQKAVAPPPEGSRPTGLPQMSAPPPRPIPLQSTQSSEEHGAAAS